MSSKRRYWIVCNYTGCQHAAVLCFLGRAWLVTIRYAIRHADRLANEIFSFARCRGIRRIRPWNHRAACVPARGSPLLPRTCMAHCYAQKKRPH